MEVVGVHSGFMPSGIGPEGTAGNTGATEPSARNEERAHFSLYCSFEDVARTSMEVQYLEKYQATCKRGISQKQSSLVAKRSYPSQRTRYRFPIVEYFVAGLTHQCLGTHTEPSLQAMWLPLPRPVYSSST